MQLYVPSGHRIDMETHTLRLHPTWNIVFLAYLNYRLFRSVLELSKCKGGVWFVYFLVTNFIFNYIVLGESGLII